MSRTGENIYKRKDGRWEGRFIKEYNSGKLHYGYVYGKTHKEAKEKLFQAQLDWNEKQQKKILQKEDAVFQIVADNWLEFRKTFLKESTLVKYQNLLRSYILPAFGDSYVSEIDDEKISTFACVLLVSGGMKKTGLSLKTVSDCLTLMKGILKYASGKNLNVQKITYSVSNQQSSSQLRVFSLQEQQKLCIYLKNHMTLSNLGILLCLFTGIRIGELCALKWDDVSFSEKTLCVEKTMQRISANNSAASNKKTQIIVSTPKSACSIRTVPIPDIIMQELTAMQKKKGTYFLTGEMNRFVEPRTMQNRFKTVLKECEINNANFHALRHTFATRCVEVGFDVKSLSEILGHANINITLNRYVHPTLERKRENMEKLSELFAVK